MSAETFRIGLGAFELTEAREQDILVCLYKTEELGSKGLAEQSSISLTTLDKRLKYLENLRMISAKGYPKKYQLTVQVRRIFEVLRSYEDINLVDVGYYYLTGEARGLEKNQGEALLIHALGEYGNFLKREGVYI